MLCEKLSGRKVEIGLVPFGSFGLTVFGLLLWWHSGGIPESVRATAGSKCWALPGLAVLVDILGLGFSAASISCRCALIQSRTAENERARVIAANNILNALFMVVSAIVSIVLLSVVKLSIPQLFLVVSLLNIGVNAYIFKIVPEFTMLHDLAAQPFHVPRRASQPGAIPMKARPCWCATTCRSSMPC
jgi:hypothetical protein